MITKKELDETINGLTEKFNHIASELESLWIEAERKGLSDFASRIERVQFDSFANPSDFTYKYHFNDLYKIIEENESAKNLDKFMELERFADRICNMADKFRENK